MTSVRTGRRLRWVSWSLGRGAGGEGARWGKVDLSIIWLL